MSDVFREVDEELRQEQLKNLWNKYGLYIVGAAAFFAIAVMANTLWDAYISSKQAKLSDQFISAQELLNQGEDLDGAKQALDTLANKTTDGYHVLSKFALADTMVRENDIDGAVALYDELSKSNQLSKEFRDLSRIKAGILLMGTASEAEMHGRMSDLILPENPWQHSARELIAFSMFKNGNLEGAMKEYLSLSSDASAPANLRTRADEMVKVIGHISLSAEKAVSTSTDSNNETAAQPSPSLPETSNLDSKPSQETE